MNNLLVERATREDNEKLNTIAYEAKSHWGYPEDWMRMWKDDLLISKEYIEGNYVYKLLYGNEIIAFIAIEEDADCFQITHLWVSPEYMGKGVGKKLLNEVVLKVVKPGVQIIVESDPNAEEFYKKQGFVTFDRRESTPQGRFLPLMRKINC